MAISPVSLEHHVRQRVDNLAYLPTTAAVAMQFVELGKNPEADPEDYVKVISADSSLSAKLLSLANSSWFGVRNKVTRPKIAVNLLGLGTVRTLAISYCLTGLHNDLKLTTEESRFFWSASLCKAVAARQYAVLRNPKLAEEAFTLGLFQDFAIPVMFACAREQVAALLDDPAISTPAHTVRERELFRLDHAEVGRTIAQKLELPELYIDAVAFHHNPASLREFIRDPILADATLVAALFPHRVGVQNAEDSAELLKILTNPEHPLDPAEFLASVQEEFNRLYAFFEPGTNLDLKLADLLHDAAREVADSTTRLVTTVHELMQQAASTGKEVHDLIRQQDQLLHAASRDKLTNAYNRDGFQQRALDTLNSSRRYRSSFALLYLDVDNFKSINDTYGHAAGDAALRAIVGAASSSLRQTDVVARLGGDEFVLLLSDISEPDARATTQRVLTQIASQRIPGLDLSTPPLSVSAGLLWVQTALPSTTLEELLTKADTLMYEAKRAGGNRAHFAHLLEPISAPTPT